MKFLLTIIQAAGLGCASAAAGRRVLHYLQLESYQLPGYVKSVRRNAMRALIPPVAMAAVGVAALRLSGLTGLALLLEALTAALLVWQAAKEKAKKPFVATERVKRLLAVHVAVNTVLALALLTVSPVLGYLLPAFEPALLMLAAGLLLCRRGSPSAAAPPPAPVRTGLAQQFLSAVTDAAAAMGRVCAFVVFFLVLLRLAETATGPWSAPAAGFMELTNGILRLTPDRRGFVTAAALLGWGGLSVHCQTAAVTAGSGIPMGRYLPAKAVQAALSAGLAWLAAPHLLP